jgi:hypothetical protein
MGKVKQCSNNNDNNNNSIQFNPIHVYLRANSTAQRPIIIISIIILIMISDELDWSNFVKIFILMRQVQKIT